MRGNLRVMSSAVFLGACGSVLGQMSSNPPNPPTFVPTSVVNIFDCAEVWWTVASTTSTATHSYLDASGNWVQQSPIQPLTNANSYWLVKQLRDQGNNVTAEAMIWDYFHKTELCAGALLGWSGRYWVWGKAWDKRYPLDQGANGYAAGNGVVQSAVSYSAIEGQSYTVGWLEEYSALEVGSCIEVDLVSYGHGWVQTDVENDSAPDGVPIKVCAATLGQGRIHVYIHGATTYGPSLNIPEDSYPHAQYAPWYTHVYNSFHDIDLRVLIDQPSLERPSGALFNYFPAGSTNYPTLYSGVPPRNLAGVGQTNITQHDPPPVTGVTAYAVSGIFFCSPEFDWTRELQGYGNFGADGFGYFDDDGGSVQGYGNMTIYQYVQFTLTAGLL